MKVVVSQSMFFPWAGLFEQMRLADVYVHYDEVQLPQGRSFITRVQIKTADGVQWLTVPVRRASGQKIAEAVVDDGPWREKHLRSLRHAYGRAPFAEEMLAIVEGVYESPARALSEINRRGLDAVAAYYGLQPRMTSSALLGIEGHGSERLLGIVQKLGGTTYITGHGAAQYLDHELFERNGIAVEYMNYARVAYPQLHGAFTPYVSILDLIANVGREGRSVMMSGTVPWREFVEKRPKAKRR